MTTATKEPIIKELPVGSVIESARPKSVQTLPPDSVIERPKPRTVSALPPGSVIDPPSTPAPAGREAPAAIETDQAFGPDDVLRMADAQQRQTPEFKTAHPDAEYIAAILRRPPPLLRAYVASAPEQLGRQLTSAETIALAGKLRRGELPEPTAADKTLWQSIWHGLARGTLTTFAAIQEAGAAAPPGGGVAWEAQSAKEIVAEHPEWQAAQIKDAKDLILHPKKLLGRVAEALPYMAGTAGTTVVATLVAGPKAGAAAGFLVAGAVEGQHAYDAALLAGATEEEAARTRFVVGIINGYIEFAQIKHIMRFAKGARRALARVAAARTLTRVGVREVGREALALVAKESLEEILQGTTEELAALGIYGKPIEPGFIDRRIQEGIIAAAATAVTAGVGRAAVRGVRAGRGAAQERAARPLRREAFLEGAAEGVTREAEAAIPEAPPVAEVAADRGPLYDEDVQLAQQERAPGAQRPFAAMTDEVRQAASAWGETLPDGTYFTDAMGNVYRLESEGVYLSQRTAGDAESASVTAVRRKVGDAFEWAPRREALDILARSRQMTEAEVEAFRQQETPAPAKPAPKAEEAKPAESFNTWLAEQPSRNRAAIEEYLRSGDMEQAVREYREAEAGLYGGDRKSMEATRAIVATAQVRNDWPVAKIGEAKPAEPTAAPVAERPTERIVSPVPEVLPGGVLTGTELTRPTERKAAEGKQPWEAMDLPVRPATGARARQGAEYADGIIYVREDLLAQAEGKTRYGAPFRDVMMSHEKAHAWWEQAIPTSAKRALVDALNDISQSAGVDVLGPAKRLERIPETLVVSEYAPGRLSAAETAWVDAVKRVATGEQADAALAKLEKKPAKPKAEKKPTPAKEAKPAAKKRIVSEDAYNAAIKRLGEPKVRGGRVPFSGADIRDAMTIVVYHFENGVRTLSEMIRKLSGRVEPRLVRHAWRESANDRDGIVAQENTDAAAGVLRRAGLEPDLEPAADNPAPPDAAIPDATDPHNEGIPDIVELWRANRQEMEQEASTDVARTQEAILRTVGGNRRKAVRIDQAIQLYIDLLGKAEAQFAEHGRKLTAAQRKLYELSQSLSPEQIDIAKQIMVMNKKSGDAGRAADVLHGEVDPYTMRLWQEEPRKVREHWPFSRFAKTTPRAKHRILDSILHGWALGKRLQVRGATNAMAIARTQVSHVIENRNLLKLAIKANLFSVTQEEGWKRVNHPNFTKWKWAGEAEPGKVYGRNVFVAPDGTLFTSVPVYAERKLARKLNNILNRSALWDIAGFSWLSKWNSLIKATILSTSFFHHQAFLRSYMLGSRGVRAGKAYREGRKAILSFHDDLRVLVRAGLTIGRNQDWDEIASKRRGGLARMIDRIPLARDFKDRLLELHDAHVSFLFRKLGANLKVYAALLEYRHLLHKRAADLETGAVTPYQLAGQVANLINDDFGGLNLEKMGRNPTLQHIFRLLALAPDWTESNVRSMAKAFKLGQESKLYRQFWARVLLKGIGTTILLNLVLSGLDDDDFWTRYKKAWKVGNLRWLDADITPIYRMLGGDDDRRKYFSLIGHFRDPIKFVTHPVRSAKHKSSVAGRMALEAVAGTDWKGHRFTTFAELLGMDEKGFYKTTAAGKHAVGEPKGGRLKGRLVAFDPMGGGPVEYEQLPSYLLHQARASLPIPIQQAMAWLAGEIDGFSAIAKSAGMYTGTAREPEPEGAGVPLGVGRGRTRGRGRGAGR